MQDLSEFDLVVGQLAGVVAEQVFPILTVEFAVEEVAELVEVVAVVVE